MSTIASYIDHTLLKADATEKEIEQLCSEAMLYGFASVCVNPYWVKTAAHFLSTSDVKVCTVIGFPLGCTSTEAKIHEAKQAILDGATELDMVLNIGALKSKDVEIVKEDIRAVVQVADGLTVKVILEVGYLVDEEVVIASQLSKSAGAHFVKTSTGFGPGGATPQAITLMRKAVGKEMGVKASGGVRDTTFANQLIALGATRIGTSSGVAIVKGEQGNEEGY